MAAVRARSIICNEVMHTGDCIRRIAERVTGLVVSVACLAPVLRQPLRSRAGLMFSFTFSLSSASAARKLWLGAPFAGLLLRVSMSAVPFVVRSEEATRVEISVSWRIHGKISSIALDEYQGSLGAPGTGTTSTAVLQTMR
jgi:hypothetical protein